MEWEMKLRVKSKVFPRVVRYFAYKVNAKDGRIFCRELAYFKNHTYLIFN